MEFLKTAAYVSFLDFVGGWVWSIAFFVFFLALAVVIHIVHWIMGDDKDK